MRVPTCTRTRIVGLRSTRDKRTSLVERESQIMGGHATIINMHECLQLPTVWIVMLSFFFFKRTIWSSRDSFQVCVIHTGGTCRNTTVHVCVVKHLKRKSSSKARQCIVPAGIYVFERHWPWWMLWLDTVRLYTVGMIGKALNTNITIKRRYKSQNSVAILENDHDTDSLFLI